MTTLIRIAAAAACCVALCAAQEPESQSSHRSAALGGRPVEQIALTTTNLERSIGFYRDTLGLRFLFQSNGMAFFDLDGVRLMLALDPLRPTTRPMGILYINAEDVAVTRQALVALDVPLEGELETVVDEPTRSLILQQFVDPDGNALAIMGWKPKPQAGGRAPSSLSSRGEAAGR